MDSSKSKAVDQSAVTGLGPYKATKLWNDAIAAFRQGVPRGRHRRYMKTVEDCFPGSSAVDWLQVHLQKYREFGPGVTRQQTSSLLNKFYKAGIFEEIQVSRRDSKKADFSDSNRLYRLVLTSPSKPTRIPLAVRSGNTALQSAQKVAKERKEKARKEEPYQKGKDNSSVTVEDKRKDAETGGRDGCLDVKTLPQCHLVGRFLTACEINEVWKTAALSRLKKILGSPWVDDTLQNSNVDGSYIRHNCIFVNKCGIVTNIPEKDQLPHWILSAMKCLARWPEPVEGELPSYPGFEKDVFSVVRDYFLGQSEPLISYELYDTIVNTFVQACNHLPLHSSPFSHNAGDRSQSGHSLFSNSSLENVILNLTRKYCMADSRADLYSLSCSRPDLFYHTDAGYSGCFSHSDIHSMSRSQGSLAHIQRDMASSQKDLVLRGDVTKGTSIGKACSHKDLFSTAKSCGNFGRASKSYCSPVQALHSRSHADLLASQHHHRLADGLINPGPVGSLHANRSGPNLHATSNTQLPKTLSSLSVVSPRSRLNLSEFPGYKESGGHACSNTSLNQQLTHYETSFGPENQTVTRVYYSNGSATDLRHEAGADCSQSTRISWGPSVRCSEGLGLSETSASRNKVEKSQSCLQVPESKSSVPLSSPYLATVEPLRYIDDEESRPNSPALPQRDCRRHLPRRPRAERFNTFAGSQFAFEHPLETKESLSGVDGWDHRLSLSTPYLPGLRLTDDRAATVRSQPRQFVSKCFNKTEDAEMKRSSSAYMSFPQTGLHEERATKALQIVCLFLPPATRRKLHFLLKLMCKMAANQYLTLDPSQSTRSLVLGTFQHAILRSRDQGELDAVLVFQLVSFLVDHHLDIMAVPTDMKDAVEDRLRFLEKPQIVYSPRDQGILRFSQPISMQQYEVSSVDHSHKALLDLLDAIVQNQNMSDREKRRRLKQFQKTYPLIYKQQFPYASSDPLQGQLKPRIKPPMFTKPLLKLKGLRV